MRVLQVSDSLTVEFGGTASSCAQLANHLATVGVESSVLTLAGNHHDLSRWPLHASVTERQCHPMVPHPLAYCPDLAAAVSAARPELVHVHGLWRLHYAQAARFAVKAGLPVVVSVHGMLHDAALAEKSMSKRMARWLYQDNLLRHAQCLHVTAAAEADHIRRLGFAGPLAVIPWGVDVPPRGDGSLASPDASNVKPRNVLYLGRLHPTKGLEALLLAWVQVAARFPTWRLVIAGSDSGDYRATLTALISRLGVAESIDWVGLVEGAARERVFRDAALLVLPSPSENFGLVIAEALARGVPVIATHGAPWAALAKEQCGWWIPVGADALADALSDALGRPGRELLAMGERGRRYARAHFAWDTTARAMRSLYCWLLGGGPMPSFVSA